jgi:hypothetical protein
VEPDELAASPDFEPDAASPEGAAHAEPRPVDRFRATAAGGVVAAGLLGLRDALEGRPEQEEVTIVQAAPTRPEDGFTLLFDPDDPSSLTIVVPGPTVSGRTAPGPAAPGPAARGQAPGESE